MDYTTTGLLANIRRRAMLPAANADGTADADLLALANDELQLGLAADLLAVREEYLNTYSDYAINGTEYRIPARALGSALRLVQLRDSTGRELVLTRLRPEQVEQWGGSGAAPFGYYLRGGYLVLVPSAATSFTTLRLTYATRPSELTTTATDYGTVTGIDRATGIVTFAGSLAGATYVDLVSGTPGFDVLASEVAVTGSSAGTVTVASSSIPSGLAYGDYVCVRRKSPVPNIPAELHPVLAIRVARTICQALGDLEQVGVLTDQLAEAEKDAALTIISPRTQGSPQKVVARANTLNGGRRRFFGYP